VATLLIKRSAQDVKGERKVVSVIQNSKVCLH